MANVPSILLIGDTMIQGGAPGVLAGVGSTGLSDLQTFGDFEALKIVPSDAATGAPTATSLGWYAWYDGAYGSTLYSVAASPAPSATTISVSPSPGWTINEFAGRYVSIVNSSTIGYSNRRPIVSNTADTLTVASWLSGTPTAGQIFFISAGA